jgi:hypothetical protein
MRTALLVLLCFGTALADAQDVNRDVSQDVNIDRTGNAPVEAKFQPAGRIRMGLCPGGIELIGTDDPVLRVSYLSGEARVRMDVIGDHADLRLSGCPHSNFRARIALPKSAALYVRMFAGQLDVRNVTGDKNVELSFGQLNIDAGKSEDYASVDASVNSGAIDASPFDVHKGGLFRSFDQTGPGKYRLHAHVGAGQIELR